METYRNLTMIVIGGLVALLGVYYVEQGIGVLEINATISIVGLLMFIYGVKKSEEE